MKISVLPTAFVIVRLSFNNDADKTDLEPAAGDMVGKMAPRQNMLD